MDKLAEVRELNKTYGFRIFLEIIKSNPYLALLTVHSLKIKP